MNPVRKVFATCGAAALALTIASCATMNRLDAYELYGASLSAEMRTPPAPRFDVRYDVTLDRRRPVYSVLSVMTNLSKASQAEKADRAMREALDTIDVPAIVLEESLSRCADALGASQAGTRAGSDFILRLDILNWGIAADWPGSSVRLHMTLTASLVRTLGREVVWQRSLSVDQPATPAMFGLDSIIGTMVTATALSEMTADDLADGFREMALESAREMARRLERDLDASRYGM